MNEHDQVSSQPVNGDHNPTPENPTDHRVGVLIGETAVGGVFVDPLNKNAIQDTNETPERAIGEYRVLATVESEPGVMKVAFVPGDKRPQQTTIPSDRWEKYIRERSVSGIPMRFYEDGFMPPSLMLSEELTDDGHLVELLYDPNIQVTTIGGPNDTGQYRLDDSTLVHVRGVGRTSLFGLDRDEGSEIAEYARKNIDNTGGPHDVSSNFGANTLGTGRGGDGEFAAIPQGVKPHQVATSMGRKK